MSPESMPAEIQSIFRYHVQTKQFTRLAELLRQHQIEFLPIKGVVAGISYPTDIVRLAGDHDIAVATTDYDEASRVLHGVEFAEINVDLHRELRHLDTLPWNQVLDRAVMIKFGGVNIRTPCPEDHLRILAVHWLNDGGQFKERLWDIYYAVENRPETFDWSECLDVVSPTRRKWVITAVGLAHRYLGLKIDDLSFAEEARQIPDWIIETVEREWATDVRLIPIHLFVRQPRQLLQQIRKRIPPNPIQATIECEGEFDDGTRIGYQVRSMFNRLVPSIKRVLPMLRRMPGKV